MPGAPAWARLALLLLLLSASVSFIAMAQRPTHRPVAIDPYVPHVPASAVGYQRAGYGLALILIVWQWTGLILLVRTGLSTSLRSKIAAVLRSRTLCLRRSAVVDSGDFAPSETFEPQETQQSAAAAPPPLPGVALYYAAMELLMLLWMQPVELAILAIERAYGFSHEAVPAFLYDEMIGAIVGLGVAPLIWAGYRLHARSPRRWWLWLWSITVPLLFFQMILQPLVIAPAYNRFTPLPSGPLRDHILALAGRAGITGAHIYVSDTSRRTRHVNAYVTGWGPTTRIVIEDTALQSLPEDQILAMVGHEMGHYVEGHLWIGFLSSSIGAAIFLWLASRLLPWLIARYSTSYGLEGIMDLAALPLILLTLNVFMQVQAPLANLESRYLEHRADAYGLRLTHLNDAMARLFVGFAERDYTDPDPPALFQWWFGTHPTLSSRISFALSYRPWITQEPSRDRFWPPESATPGAVLHPSIQGSGHVQRVCGKPPDRTHGRAANPGCDQNVGHRYPARSCGSAAQDSFSLT